MWCTACFKTSMPCRVAKLRQLPLTPKFLVCSEKKKIHSHNFQVSTVVNSSYHAVKQVFWPKMLCSLTYTSRVVCQPLVASPPSLSASMVHFFSSMYKWHTVFSRKPTPTAGCLLTSSPCPAPTNNFSCTQLNTLAIAHQLSISAAGF